MDKDAFYDKYVSNHLLFVGAPLQLDKRHRRYFEANYFEFLPRDKQARILDLGCGTGVFLEWLREIGFSNTFGVDLGEEQVNYCRKRGLHVQMSDVFDFLRDTDEGFDVIFMQDLIEHFKKEELMTLLRLTHEHLKPGGTQIGRTPNMSNPLFGMSSRYYDLTHEAGFTESSLRQLFANAGFRRIMILRERLGTTTIRRLVARLSYGVGNTIMRQFFKMHGRNAEIIMSKNLIFVCRKQ